MPTREFSLIFLFLFSSSRLITPNTPKRQKQLLIPQFHMKPNPSKPQSKEKKKRKTRKKQKNKSQALHKQNTGSLLSSRAPYNESLNDDVIPSRSLTLRPRVFKIPLRLLSVWLAPFSSRALRYSWRFLGDLWWRVASRVCREFAVL